MKSVLRMRHYCDFCKKAGQSSYHMKKHETHCTLNPDRKCRLCERLGLAQASMADLLALLPNPALHQTQPSWSSKPILDDEGIKPLVAAAMPRLRDLTDVCPICVMAALRQRGIPVPMVEDFNFTAELKSVWADINADERCY